MLIPLRHSPSWPRLTSLFSAWNHPHLFSSSARALSPLGPQVTDGDEEGETDAPAVKKSRNELKREASRAVHWGMELAKFSAPQIKQVLRSGISLSTCKESGSKCEFFFSSCFSCSSSVCRIASVEREVFEALILVKVMHPLYDHSTEILYDDPCFVSMLYLGLGFCCEQRLGPDVREGKRRQFNYIGKLKQKGAKSC